MFFKWEWDLFFNSRWVLATFVFLFSSQVFAKMLVTPEQVLKEQFGSAISIEHKNFLLTRDQKKATAKLAKSKVDSNLFSVYFARENGKIKGYAFLDHQKIRTKHGVIMICFDQGGVLQRVEIIAFFEPTQYIPNKAWLSQFAKQELNEPVMPGRNVTGLTGATLSAQAVSRSVNIAHSLWKLKFSKDQSMVSKK